ncbi:MAG: aminotransferase class I/II-fold pyridoxal phosphate-dependent enzyme [Solibacillus sp.]
MQGQLIALANAQFAKAQDRMPLYEALVNYANSDVTSFDVPGHKRGLDMHPLHATLGNMTLKMDANSMQELDLLSHPESVIKEAQELAAQAFGASHAYFLVNGTTVGILAMILATCKQGDTLIVPRNCHKSVMNGILLSGARPVFIQPEIDAHFGIAHGISVGQVKRALEENPQAKAILVTYPTYFGAMNELRTICELAHAQNVVVLVDSAHGAHLSMLPNAVDAITAGADAVTMSMHKTGGSLTQSSLLLLQDKRLSPSHMQKTLNMLQTTSASYLLMSSLDVARRELALYGRERFENLQPIVMQAIDEIEHGSKYEVLKADYVKAHFGQRYDWTKLVIRVNDLGLTGFEVYTLLKQQFNIQAELAEGYTVMCVISYQDNFQTIDRLVRALRQIELLYAKDVAIGMQSVVNHEMNELAMTPQEASQKPHEIVNIYDAIGRVSADSVMIYPPGIPLIIPGEVISANAVELYDFYSRNIGNVLIETDEKNTITVIGGDK